MEFKWSQSALKDLERETGCPEKWKARWIDKTIKFEPSVSMNNGNFFEYKCIGACAHGDIVKDLPKTSTNKPTAIETRILQQVDVFKDITNPDSPNFCGFSVEDVQVRVSGVIGGVDVGGVIDFIGRQPDGARRIVDLKLSDDVFGEFGYYKWGADSIYWDLLQQVTYSKLFYQQFNIKLPTTLMLFESGVKSRVRIIDVEFCEDALESVEQRFRQGDDVLNLYKERGWVTLPSETECKDCPLQCKDKIEQKLITYEKVSI